MATKRTLTTTKLSQLQRNALTAMCQKARELGVPEGVAGVLIVPDREGQDPSIVYRPVNNYTTGLADNGYSMVNHKAAVARMLAAMTGKITYMERTHSDSGSRPPAGVMIDEDGDSGGVQARNSVAHLFTAFIGGSETQNISIAKEGLETLLTIMETAEKNS